MVSRCLNRSRDMYWSFSTLGTPRRLFGGQTDYPGTRVVSCTDTRYIPLGPGLEPHIPDRVDGPWDWGPPM